MLDTRLSRRFRKAYWALAQSAGRIVALWEDGFAVELRLTIHGDSLSGVGYYTNDIGNTHRTSIRAARVTCPATSSAIAVRGRVTSSTTAKPVIAASVTLENLPTGVMTNDHGVFELQVPRPDRNDIVLVIRSMGYQAKRIRVPITLDSLQNIGDIIMW